MLLAIVGWKCGCQPFSCPCSQNVTHCEKKRFVGHVCLRNPFPPFLFRIPSIHSLLEASSWEKKYAVPLLQRQEKDACYAEKQRVWLRSFFSPRFVTVQWLCFQSCYVTAANQWAILEIELLAIVGWKCGCQPFSCPCSQNVTHCEKKRFVGHVRLRNPFPPFLFGIPSIHSLPEAGSWEQQYALHYGCIMPVPLLQRQEKDASYAEKQRVWSRSCFLQDLLQNSDCALSCAMWLLQTNEQLLRLSF